jgi:SOS response associated peptidase (SRAP)
MAGIYAREPTEFETAEKIQVNFATLTTKANEAVAHIHDRMPVILPLGIWAVLAAAIAAPSGENLVVPHGTELFPLFNPSTKEVIGQVRLADEEDGMTEYQPWLDDSSPDKKPFELEFRAMMELRARMYRRSRPVKPPAYWEPRGKPSDANQHIFELLGIDWRPAAT